MNAISRRNPGTALTYADAAMIVAAERGDRPTVRVPSGHGYSSLSNAARQAEAEGMFAAITAREEWDRAVKRVLAGSAREPLKLKGADA